MGAVIYSALAPSRAQYYTHKAVREGRGWQPNCGAHAHRYHKERYKPIQSVWITENTRLVVGARVHALFTVGAIVHTHYITSQHSINAYKSTIKMFIVN